MGNHLKKYQTLTKRTKFSTRLKLPLFHPSEHKCLIVYSGLTILIRLHVWWGRPARWLPFDDFQNKSCSKSFQIRLTTFNKYWNKYFANPCDEIQEILQQIYWWPERILQQIQEKNRNITQRYPQKFLNS